MTERVEIQGAARLSATLDRAAAELAEPTAALDASGRLLETRGRGLAPVATGALAASVRAATEPQAVTVASALPYSAVTEYGGGNNIPAQPFLRPALANSEPLIVAEFLKAINTALSKVEGI